MPRPIKFRAWDGERMINNSFTVHADSGLAITTTEPNSGEAIYRSAWKVMQFTGLLDKNDKEIYEGDIVRGFRQNYRYRKPADIQELIFEVWYDEIDCAFKLWYPKMQWDSFMTMDRPYEIIGNIYENPDLLTK